MSDLIGYQSESVGLLQKILDSNVLIRTTEASISVEIERNIWSKYLRIGVILVAISL